MTAAFVRAFDGRALVVQPCDRPCRSVLQSRAILRITSTTQPPVIDPFGVAFVMQARDGLVKCHVFRAAMDELERSHARNDAELLRRFDEHRRRLETVADRMYGAGHQSPWIDVADLLLGVTPEDYDD